MSVIDRYGLLSEDLALPASATSEYSTNEIDMGAGVDAFGSAMVQNFSQGRPIYLNFVMATTAATASGSPTLTLDIVGGTSTGPTTVLQTICSAVADTTLVAGYKFSVALRVFPEMTRFVRLKVTANDAGFDVGTYTAWLSDQPMPEKG